MGETARVLMSLSWARMPWVITRACGAGGVVDRVALAGAGAGARPLAFFSTQVWVGRAHRLITLSAEPVTTKAVLVV